MIIYTSNILALPVGLAIWAVDAYLFLAIVRLGLLLWGKPEEGPLCTSLRHLTDGPPDAVDRWCSCGLTTGARWAIVVFAGLLIRALLAGLLKIFI